MVVVYAMTKNLYRAFRASLLSLLDHNSPGKVYIFAETDELPYSLPECCRVINVSALRSRFDPDGPNARSIFTWMAMARSLYAEIIPDDKVIQLDVDTIICDSLEPIWSIDLTGRWFAACPEYESSWRPYGDDYYNIGVSVFNLEQIRADNVVPKIVEMLNTVRCPCVEQDAWNCFGIRADKVVKIPVRYNESFCCGRTEDPAVVHFAGYPNWFDDRSVTRVEYLDQYRDR